MSVRGCMTFCDGGCRCAGVGSRRGVSIVFVQSRLVLLLLCASARDLFIFDSSLVRAAQYCAFAAAVVTHVFCPDG